MSGFTFNVCALFPTHFALETNGSIKPVVRNDEKYNTFLRPLVLQTILNVHFPHVLFYKQNIIPRPWCPVCRVHNVLFSQHADTQTNTVPICNPRSLPRNRTQAHHKSVKDRPNHLARHMIHLNPLTPHMELEPWLFCYMKEGVVFGLAWWEDHGEILNYIYHMWVVSWKQYPEITRDHPHSKWYVML